MEPLSGPELWSNQHQAFRQTEGWKRQVYVNSPLLEQVNSSNSSVKISLADQRGYLLKDGGYVVMDFPVATGKYGYATPAGSYSVLSKKANHASNLYGRFVDIDTGRVVRYDAAVREDPLPAGAKFVGASMPMWMRLTHTGIGMHIGNVPGYPASHGCIRVVRPAMERLYPLCRPGTRVRVHSAWSPPMAMD
ncbi:L,D-transpeptidase [Sulfuriroseicoccus oceanibius]|uniref:L,D-transpeptidase n=1 Tax=Sulfuriroseicoccus oceanibius TaxID=2707525 RepID=A0A6B3L6U0_9BACT|nr:L,D-transpeptidase [Sulfuriroseicoccus oceanibius]QQL43781.1 L,D-transpeptidase [Sulfuriroseicoccus oceanibius]